MEKGWTWKRHITFLTKIRYITLKISPLLFCSHSLLWTNHRIFQMSEFRIREVIHDPRNSEELNCYVSFFFLSSLYSLINQTLPTFLCFFFSHKQICKELEVVRSEKGSMRILVIHNCYKCPSIVGWWLCSRHLSQLPFLQESWELLTGIFVKEAEAPSV